LWYEVVRCHGLSNGYFSMIPSVRMRMWIVWKCASCMKWIVVGLERYLRYGVGWKGALFVESSARIS
jgi:hypothetical protein